MFLCSTKVTLFLNYTVDKMYNLSNWMTTACPMEMWMTTLLVKTHLRYILISLCINYLLSIFSSQLYTIFSFLPYILIYPYHLPSSLSFLLKCVISLSSLSSSTPPPPPPPPLSPPLSPYSPLLSLIHVQ